MIKRKLQLIELHLFFIISFGVIGIIAEALGGAPGTGLGCIFGSSLAAFGPPAFKKLIEYLT